ncbi:hypothetical protein MRB53_035867 [Persea americana]|uniref:Uncharacterized protein n=1 Tax=Persea americana TaxID=3435 RepID=A0ACC2K5U7_PERAE|nr:hypothetical protein MRB53_035867 [Persea americana]
MGEAEGRIGFGMSRKNATESTQTMETAAFAASAKDAPNPAYVNTWAVTDYISKFDEAAQQRLNNINQKLRDLERQMEVLEAEMTKANDFERMILEAP